MITVMLDNDISGHSDLLAGTLTSTGWAEYELVKFISLTDGGLARNVFIRLSASFSTSTTTWAP